MLAQIVGSARRQYVLQRPAFGAALHLRKEHIEPFADNLVEVASGDLLRIDELARHYDVECEFGLHEGRYRLDEDVGQQNDEEQRGEQDRRQPIMPEATFGAISPCNSGARRVRREVDAALQGTRGS